MVNPLDRLVGWFNPEAGLKRTAARARMEILRSEVRSYEGASNGRLAKNWNITSGTADRQISRYGQTLRERSRDLVRNNPHAAKIVATHANHLVGFGIMPRAKCADETLAKKVNELFDKWSKVCNVSGRLDFYGTSYLLARMMVTDGEAFVRRRRRLAKDKLPVPLQIQVLDSEFCDWGKTVMNGQNSIINGIEFDPLGRRQGYWLHPNNPAGQWPSITGNNQSSFVPAEDVAHLYELQTNQIRGAPWLSPVIGELREVKDYELAENVRKKIEACMVGVVVPDNSEDPNIGLMEKDGDGSYLTDMEGNPVNRMEPGMFAVMRNGGDIRFNTPAISAGVEAYLRTRYRSIAAGARLPYELMTGDYSQSNFASGQLGLIDYRVFLEAIVWHCIIPQAMQMIWDWFIEAARADGKIPLKAEIDVVWQPPEFERLNRLDQARADLIEIRMGKRSLPEVIAKTGRNPEDVLKENDEYFKKVDETTSKLVLDSDPRKVAINGQAQWISDPAGGTSAAGN